MKHKIFSLFLTLIAGIVTVSAFESIEVDGIYYVINTLSTQYTVWVSYRGDYSAEYPDEYSGDVVIPSSINYNGNTYSVTSIEGDAFAGCTGLTSVVIPNTVTAIGYNAFLGCTALISATIPNSVRQIGNSAFSGCTSLTSVSVPNSVTKIEYNAFFNVPNVVYEGEATWKTDNMWWGAKSLNGFVDGWLVYSDESKTKLLACSTAATGEITIPNSVTEIGEKAFRDCAGITSITIGNSVTTIGEWAFAECTGLTSVVIPESVIEIGSYAFWQCIGLISVTVGSSVTTIGDDAFNSCANLTSVTIPNSVTTIGNGAFTGCTSLTSVTIGNSVTSIGDWAFGGCYNLSSVTIPNSVTEIGRGAFNEVLNIAYFGTVEGSPWGAECLNGFVEDWFVYADNTKTDLLACSYSAMGEITIPNTVTSIGEYAFYGRSGLTSVIIPNSVTTIGNYAFVYCTGLTSITIPNSVKYIPYDAFAYCKGLTSVTIPESVIEIGSYAFRDCVGLTSVAIPNSVTSIGDWVFGGCTGLTSVTLGNSVTSIGESSFYNCTGLTSVIIPNSVTTIGSDAFGNCSGMSSVIIGNSVTIIGNWAFSYCTGLISVDIPNSVTEIDARAFYNCTGLTSVTIPNSVTSIGGYAFADCSGLTSITCEATIPPTCGEKVFFEVDKSIPLHVPANSVEDYKAAYEWKEFGDNIRPISAPEVAVTEPQAEAADNSVVVEWPEVIGATVYVIQIWKGDELVCTLSFNEQGQLLSMTFEKKAGKDSPRTATQTEMGWQYTIGGLESGTEYIYIVVAKNGNTELFRDEKLFTTTMATTIDELSNEKMRKCENAKIMLDGQILILRNGRTYTITGAEVR